MMLRKLLCISPAVTLVIVGLGHGAAPAVPQMSDFDTVYQAVKAKHDLTHGDLSVDMKVWLPFVVQTLKATDLHGFTSEQLLRLQELDLFQDSPLPDDDGVHQVIVKLVEDRDVKGPYDALLKLTFVPDSSKLRSDPELLGRLYQLVVQSKELKGLAAGPHSGTLLGAVAALPKAVLDGHREDTLKLAEALPRVWPVDWAFMERTLIEGVFAASNVGTDMHRKLRQSAIDSLGEFLKSNPSGRMSDYIKLQFGKLTGASSAASVIGKEPEKFAVAWCSDPSIKSLADLKGRVVVLDFWATWCHFCVLSFPNMRAIQQEFGNSGVTVLSVTSLQGFVQGLEAKTIDTKGKPALEYRLTRKFMDKEGAAWPTVFTRENVYNPGFGIEGLPTTVILDREGKVRFVGINPYSDIAKVREAVQGLLKADQGARRRILGAASREHGRGAAAGPESHDRLPRPRRGLPTSLTLGGGHPG